MSPSRSLSPIHPASPLGSASSGEPQPLEGDIETDVLVVGAGLAGLTSALTAARAGARVVVLDARRKIGARARSEQIDGFTINEGAHALYRKGSAAAVLRNLGIDASGRMPTQRGGAWWVDEVQVPWRRTSVVGGTASALRAFRRIFSKRSALGAEGRSLDDWLDEHVPDASFLVLLDELDPVERAVVLLHDVFGYPFAAVAESVERSETAVRQMASRARRRLRDGRSRASRRPSDQQVQELLGPVLSAVSAGDVEVVMAHMAPDVVEMSDGGAAVRAGRRPVVGPERVARLLINLAKRGSHLNIRYAEVNLRPGFVFSDGTEPFLAMSVDFDEQGRVSRLFSVLNPEKLTHLGEEGASPPLD